MLISNVFRVRMIIDDMKSFILQRTVYFEN